MHLFVLYVYMWIVYAHCVCIVFCICELYIHILSGIVFVYVNRRGRDRWVGIATSYGLDGPGIESRWGRDFPHACRPVLGPTHNDCRVFPGGKAAGTWRWPSTPSSAEVKERVELYLYPWVLVACFRVNFTLYVNCI